MTKFCRLCKRDVHKIAQEQGVFTYITYQSVHLNITNDGGERPIYSTGINYMCLPCVHRHKLDWLKYMADEKERIR